MKKLLFALCFIPLMGYCEENTDCSKVENNGQRLSCYDNIAKKQQENEVSYYSGWEYKLKKDDFTDEETEFANKLSENEGDFSTGKSKVELLLFADYAKSNQTISFSIPKVDFPCTSDDDCKVKYRVDKGNIGELSCHKIEDEKSYQLQCPFGYDLQRKLKNAKKFMIRFPQLSENDNTFSFDMTEFPFVGIKSYSIDELKNMIAKNEEIKLIEKREETSLDVSKLNRKKKLGICKNSLLTKHKDSPVRILIDSQDEFSYMYYYELGAISYKCNRNDKNMLLKFYRYG